MAHVAGGRLDSTVCVAAYTCAQVCVAGLSVCDCVSVCAFVSPAYLSNQRWHLWTKLDLLSCICLAVHHSSALSSRPAAQVHWELCAPQGASWEGSMPAQPTLQPPPPTTPRPRGPACRLQWPRWCSTWRPWSAGVLRPQLLQVSPLTPCTLAWALCPACVQGGLVARLEGWCVASACACAVEAGRHGS